MWGNKKSHTPQAVDPGLKNVKTNQSLKATPAFWERTPVRACSREPDLKVVRGLRFGRGGCSLLKNWGRLADFRDAKKDERHIRTGLQTATW
jgi:hypothetical protein